MLLYDPNLDKIVMVRQFRAGALEDADSPWMLELIAGLVDKDESLEDVAIRESIEESDCIPTEIIRICDYYNSPGASNEKVTLFCGRVDASTAGGIHGLAEEHEDIEVVVLPLEEAVGAVNQGIINNAMSIIAIQWLEINRNKLMQRWISS